MKVLHVISGTIIETGITQNTLDRLFSQSIEEITNSNTGWADVRRFIDAMDKAGVYTSSDKSYYVDLKDIQETMCIDEFELLIY